MWKHFLRAVSIGALVAGCLPALGVLVVANAFILTHHADPLRTTVLTLLPFAASFVLVAASALVVGVPTTFLLRRSGRESAGAYAWVGGTTGAALTTIILLLDLIGGATFPILLAGAIAAGVATGLSWWKHTGRAASRNEHPPR